MTLEEAADLLGVDYKQELDALSENPNSQQAVKLAIAFRDHPEGGAEKLVDLIFQVGEKLGINIREDIGEVIPNLDWWLEESEELPVIVANIEQEARA